MESVLFLKLCLELLLLFFTLIMILGSWDDWRFRWFRWFRWLMYWAIAKFENGIILVFRFNIIELKIILHVEIKAINICVWGVFLKGIRVCGEIFISELNLDYFFLVVPDNLVNHINSVGITGFNSWIRLHLIES
jgi:hypothetical protein